MKPSTNFRGFTLVEIMIVVMIIGLLAAIAVPNFSKAKQKSRQNICINNLRLIAAAKDQSAAENGYEDTEVLTAADLTPFLKGNQMPSCPSRGGVYTINAISVSPVCSFSATLSHSIS